MFGKKSDADIKHDVINEIKWDPSLLMTKITVSVNEGIVTLIGNVPHYFEKISAEQAAQRVSGVQGVADELEVKGSSEKTDDEILRVAVDALKWSYIAPKNIKVSVDKGQITLRGEADWDYQRNAASDSVRTLMGVTGVTNNIIIKSTAQPSDIKNRIDEALKRSAESAGRKINVAVSGDVVTLSGTVHSIAEKENVRNAAWMAPGILRVENNLRIEL